jgi:uncharacterized membrane protein
MRQNVGSIERALSLGLGGAMTAWGLSRRNTAGRVVALAGAAIAFRGAGGYCPVYGAAGLTTADELPQGAETTSVPYGSGINVEKAITIDKTPAELYAFWRQFENLPRFMKHLESVTQLDSRRSHWVAKGPAGTSIEWDAEIINEIPNELIGWRSLEGSDVAHAGSVHFTAAPGNRGTYLEVILRYDPPGGKLSAKVAKMFGEEPSLQIGSDLRRLKQLLETGEIATTDGQPRGDR